MVLDRDNMEPERIGGTPRERLKWVLDMVERTLPRSEGDWLNLREEIRMFVGTSAIHVIDPATLTDPKRFHSFFTELLDNYREMIDRAVGRDRGLTLSTQRMQETLVWDSPAGRFRKESIRHSETFATLALRPLNDLLLTHGHLLKRCEAPAKMRAGRKPRKQTKEEPGGICGNLFVAVKETQLYCSSA